MLWIFKFQECLHQILFDIFVPILLTGTPWFLKKTWIRISSVQMPAWARCSAGAVIRSTLVLAWWWLMLTPGSDLATSGVSRLEFYRDASWAVLEPGHDHNITTPSSNRLMLSTVHHQPSMIHWKFIVNIQMYQEPCPLNKHCFTSRNFPNRWMKSLSSLMTLYAPPRECGPRCHSPRPRMKMSIYL